MSQTNLFTGQPESGAVLSTDRVYRYKLWRQWADRSMCVFIGLNPSTADETEDDPTIRRCIHFAQVWGHGGLVMLNLFALRSKRPDVLRKAPRPIGPDNDKHIAEAVAQHERVVACWGVHGVLRGRGDQVEQMVGVDRLMCFGLTQSHQPRHPLYVRGDASLVLLPC